MRDVLPRAEKATVAYANHVLKTSFVEYASPYLFHPLALLAHKHWGEIAKAERNLQS
jgi:hypothetical protein